MLLPLRSREQVFCILVMIPDINPATAALLDNIRDELITETTIGMREIVDPKAIHVIRDRFMSEAENLLKTE